MSEKETSIFQKSILAAAIAALLCSPVSFADDDDERDGDSYSWYDRDRDRDDDDDDDHHDDGVTITFAHSGDFHGDYHPHTNGRGDSAGMLEGGMARAVTVLRKIRRNNDNVIHVHTGDTIHGSGEASITKGMALVKMVDQLGIDVSTPGNWEWAYTPYRYMQFFGVHNADGKNMDIVDNADFDTSVYKAVKYSADEIGDVPTFGTSFKKVKYVESYNLDGTPNMATGYNRWGMVAANAYVNGTKGLDHGVVNKGVGMNMTPPYRIIEKDGVKIGFIGCTTNRGPQVVSSTITVGAAFSNCKGGIKFPQNRPIDWEDKDIAYGGKGKAGGVASDEVQAGNRDAAAETTDWTVKPHWGGNAGYQVKNEIVKWTKHLREVEGVDLVAVMSEAGIAENIFAAENLGKGPGGTPNPDWKGPDIYFSSDMHEELNYPAVVTDPSGKKVIILENSEDIAQIGELDITVKNGKITKWKFTDHDVNETVWPNWRMKGLVRQIDQEISDSITAGTAYNPYNGHQIIHQLNEKVGETDDMILERNRFTTEFDPANLKMPAVIEGTGHDLVTDMFRKLTGADVGGLRGFRYTNSVLDGDDITYKSLYHFFPIGPQVAVGPIPTTPASEPAPDLSGTDTDGDGCVDADSDCNGFVLKDQADNKRHYIGFPRSLQMEMELAGNSTMNPNIPKWGGGWFWAYSGVKFDMQPTGGQFNKYGTKLSARISNMKYYDNTNGKADGESVSNAPGSMLKYASYYYHEDYNRINRNQLVTKGKCKKKGYSGLTKECIRRFGGIQILAKEAGPDGDYVMVDAEEYDAHILGSENRSKGVTTPGDGKLLVLDTVEALGRYINEESIEVYDWVDGAKGALLRTVAGLDGELDGDDLEFPRVNLVKQDGTPGNDLTDCTIEFGSPCIQPMRGAEKAFGASVPKPGDYIVGTAETPALSGEL